MVEIKKDRFLLCKTDYIFEIESILCPTVTQNENGTHIFYVVFRIGNYSDGHPHKGVVFRNFPIRWIEV